MVKVQMKSFAANMSRWLQRYVFRVQLRSFNELLFKLAYVNCVDVDSFNCPTYDHTNGTQLSECNGATTEKCMYFQHKHYSLDGAG